MSNVPTTALLKTLVGQCQIFDLGREYTVGMAQSPNHPPYWHALPRRHGDMVREDGGSAANDIITLGTHVGTHIDAFSHVSQDGLLCDGSDAFTASKGGKFHDLGAHTIEPMLRRGVLLDIPKILYQEDSLPGGHEITPAELEVACTTQGITINPGDVVLIRSGWGRLFRESNPALYVGKETGVPGVGEAGAQWLAEHSIHAAGADTIAFEQLVPGQGHASLPAHRVLLVEKQIYIIEALDLEGISQAGLTEFLFVLSPLKLFGATGSPVRPLAVIVND